MVNPYDNVRDTLRVAALRRDAALAGTASAPKAPSTTEDAAIAFEANAPKPAFSGDYVAKAIAAYAINAA